jgi:hypothetical protein
VKKIAKKVSNRAMYRFIKEESNRRKAVEENYSFN